MPSKRQERLAGRRAAAGDAIVEGGHWQPKTYAQLPLHTNDGLELVIVHRGHASWLVDGVPHRVAPGDLFITLPWQLHGSAEPVDPAIELDWLVLPVIGDQHSRMLRFGDGCGVARKAGSALLQRLRERTSPLLRPTPALIDYVRITAAEFRAQADDRDQALGLQLPLLIHELHRSLQQSVSSPSHSLPDSVVAAWASICQRHDHPWTVASMAAEAGLRPTRFSILIKQHTGDSPLVALTRERLRAACTDLTSSDRSITAIAFAHGFGSSQAFAKVFRRYCLQSPSAYRRSGGQFAPQFAV